MSMMGQLYRVSPARLARSLAEPSEIQSELYPDDYPANMEQHGEDVEKTWDAIGFILDRLAEEGTIPWIAPLTGGTETGCVLHYSPVWYRTPGEVAETTGVLSSISRNDFRAGFVPESMSAHNVYPSIWDEEDKDALFDYVWRHFEDTVRFYRAAAGDGDALLLHLA